MDSEVFGKVRDLSGYEIGSRGTVISHLNPDGPRVMARFDSSALGYPTVCLQPDSASRSRNYRLGRLVLTAHVGAPPSENAIVKYRDRDRTNVRVENLYWYDAGEARRQRMAAAAIAEAPVLAPALEASLWLT